MREKREIVRLALPYLVLVLVVVGAMAILIGQTLKAAGDEYASVLADNVRYHVGGLDDAVSNVDEMLQAQAAGNVDLIAMAWNRDPDTFMLYKYRVWKDFSRRIYQSPVVGCYFFYTVGCDDYLQAVQGETDYAFRQAAGEAVAEAACAGTLKPGWQTLQVDGNFLLVRTLSMSNMIMGYWVRASALLSDLPVTASDVEYSLINEEGQLLSKSRDGKMLTSTDDDSGFVTRCSVNSATGQFRITVAVETMSMLHQMSFRDKAAIVICFLVIMACILWTLVSYLHMLRPMERLVQTMKRISGGCRDARVEVSQGTTREIALLCNTFNSMMDQMDDLQIRNYEQQLRLKNSELERLKLQINPHFFINSLNGIRSYAMQRNYQAITEMVVYMADYFRFVLRPSVMVVPLYQELEHTYNYIRIQQFRFADRLQYAVDVPPSIEQAMVPILILHTFVDNAVKYAMESEQPSIRVSGCMTSEELISLSVEDNGDGFSEESLNKLNQAECMTDVQGNHVGIWNLRERMDEFFAGKASMRFENRVEGGGRITLIFPYISRRVE